MPAHLTLSRPRRRLWKSSSVAIATVAISIWIAVLSTRVMDAGPILTAVVRPIIVIVLSASTGVLYATVTTPKDDQGGRQP